jgi:septal ring factor EnvC (AmiA/AmiB activator)
MNSTIETRVSKLEGITGKLASLTNDLYSGQKTVVEVLQDMGMVIGSEIREQISIEMIAQTEILKHNVNEEITDVKKDVEKVKETLKETGLDRHKQNDISEKIASRVKQLVGKKNSVTYILFYSAYRGRITKLLKQHYNVSSYKDISLDEFESALKLIDILTPESWFDNYILESWRDKIENNEAKEKEIKAYKEYIS